MPASPRGRGRPRARKGPPRMPSSMAFGTGGGHCGGGPGGIRVLPGADAGGTGPGRGRWRRCWRSGSSGSPGGCGGPNGSRMRRSRRWTMGRPRRCWMPGSKSGSGSRGARRIGALRRGRGRIAWGRVVVEDFAGARVLDRLLLYERRIESSLYRTMAELRGRKRARHARRRGRRKKSHARSAAFRRGRSP